MEAVLFLIVAMIFLDNQNKTPKSFRPKINPELYKTIPKKRVSSET